MIQFQVIEIKIMNVSIEGGPRWPQLRPKRSILKLKR